MQLLNNVVIFLTGSTGLAAWAGSRGLFLPHQIQCTMYMPSNVANSRTPTPMFAFTHSVGLDLVGI